MSLFSLTSILWNIRSSRGTVGNISFAQLCYRVRKLCHSNVFFGFCFLYFFFFFLFLSFVLRITTTRRPTRVRRFLMDFCTAAMLETPKSRMHDYRCKLIIYTLRENFTAALERSYVAFSCDTRNKVISKVSQLFKGALHNGGKST